MSLPLKVLPSPQMWTSSSFMAMTSMVPVTARPIGRGVEVVHAGGGDVEGAGLQRGDALGDELLAAVDQARLLGAVLQGAARDLVVIGLVGLAEVGRVGVGNGALGAHPMDGGAGIEAAGEGEADLFARRQVLKNVSHVMVIGINSAARGGPTFRIACKRCGAEKRLGIYWPHPVVQSGIPGLISVGPKSAGPVI